MAEKQTKKKNIFSWYCVLPSFFAGGPEPCRGRPAQTYDLE